MSLLRDIKSNISGYVAYMRASLVNCDCYRPEIFVKFKHINPKTDFWEYDIRCNYCGKVHFKSDKGK
jgi:hypothetical protein